MVDNKNTDLRIILEIRARTFKEADYLSQRSFFFLKLFLLCSINDYIDVSRVISLVKEVAKSLQFNLPLTVFRLHFPTLYKIFSTFESVDM